MSSVIQVVCVFHLCAWTPHDVQQPATLTVAVNVTFDRSPASIVMTRWVQGEAQAIWNAYGVALRGPDDQRADAALHLDVIVDRAGADDDARRPHPELGHTTLDCRGFARGPIHIWMDAIEETIGPSPALDLAHRERRLAVAIGRVLAHEIGHELLGTPAYHDAEGLMRSSFGAGELTEVNRWPFRLGARSVSRLRARVATWFEPVAAGSCA